MVPDVARMSSYYFVFVHLVYETEGGQGDSEHGLVNGEHRPMLAIDDVSLCSVVIYTMECTYEMPIF